jgi:hypothetical protein
MQIVEWRGIPPAFVVPATVVDFDAGIDPVLAFCRAVGERSVDEAIHESAARRVVGRRISLMHAGLVLLLLVAGCALVRPSWPHDPGAAHIVADDIPRFWVAFDARQRLGAARAFDSLYLRPGSHGLRDWTQKRLGGPAELALVVERAAAYYASARESTLRARALEPEMRAAFRRLEEIYPDAVFPDVYLLIGRLSSGGTTSGAGLLIGTEMFGRTRAYPTRSLGPWLDAVLRPIDELPAIVAHELVHCQQPRPGRSLLAIAINEGTADFVGEMISGANINAHVHAWAIPREREVWIEFRAAMHGSDLGNWFSLDTVRRRPKDLGYFSGYRIAEAYYARMENKREAIRDILRARDARALLERSGYADRFR